MIGDLIDHYRVLELVGRGAMGVVYKALDVNLDRLVAIKLMSAEARSDPAFVERFRQEARLQGALNHPNVALLFDYFVHEGAPVAVMEFIQGESLEQMIRRRGRIPAHESIPIFKQALRGVAAAHRAGIIHRDLKPTNLMITRDDVVKVMDFGIAKRQGATGATKVSTSIGTSLYMAPEQILGRAVDCRTDVYALGITLYELLSGQPPFNPRGKAEFMVLNAHVNDLPEPPTVHCRDIPPSIVDAVMRALAKEPDARFQSADEFMRALPEVLAPDAPAPRVDRHDTLVLEYAAPMSGKPCATRQPSGTAPVTATWSNHSTPSSPPPSAAAQGARAAPAGVKPLLRVEHPVVLAVLAATLVFGSLVRHAERRQATLQRAALASNGPRFTPAQASAATPTRASTAAAAPLHAITASGAEPALAPSAAVAAPGAAGAARPTSTALAPPTAPAPAPARQDLAGTWRGAYIDASGKQLLRVASLSISRVHDDGGIEGTLQYEAASGDGECQLRPSGSTYSLGEQRLQLSPESCSPHYPKELGVPLDFDDVNPRANTLNNGRIEAPTGEVIRVKLERVSGI